MKYLFFDIECSNCFNNIGKMCEFGYVVTDENFKIITKNCYAMSPGKGGENKFKLRNRKNQVDIELAYEYEYYYEQPEFDVFYDKIKKLIEDKDTICFAWSIENDMKYLFNACERYNKNPYTYSCYELQEIACKYLEDNKKTHLIDTCKKIVGNDSTIQLQAHLSRDDAIMTMKILEKICVTKNIDSKDLVLKFNFSKLSSNDVENKIKIKRFKKNNNKLVEEIVSQDKTLITQDEYKNNIYCISGKVKSYFNDINKLINFIHDNGGVLTNSLLKADYIIVYDDENKKEIESKLDANNNTKMILVNDFLGVSLK